MINKGNNKKLIGDTINDLKSSGLTEKQIQEVIIASLKQQGYDVSYLEEDDDDRK